MAGMKDFIQEKVEPQDNRIAIQVSVTRSFDEGQGVTWATTIPQNYTIEQINGVMDKIWSASTRQSQLNRIDRIDKEIAHNVQQMSQLQYSLKSLEARHINMEKAPSDARAAYTQTKDNLVRFNTLIDGLHDEQKRMRAELGVK
jgi:septal ring factor EnvC (AmiA/AmiB activator)